MTSVNPVAKISPKVNVTAIGIMNFAWKLVSNISGVRPAAVVRVVSRIARRRSLAPSILASKWSMPLRTRLLIKSTRTSESFTRIQLRATIPIRLRMVIGLLVNRCPMMAPWIPNGIAAITTSGWPYERNRPASIM